MYYKISSFKLTTDEFLGRGILGLIYCLFYNIESTNFWLGIKSGIFIYLSICIFFHVITLGLSGPLLSIF